jgi:hypothetical protein
MIMPENPNASAAQSPENDSRLEIAKYYTLGDEQRAGQMLEGGYKDVYVFKGKYSSPAVYGAFITFYNFERFYHVSTQSILTRSFEIGEIDPEKGWKEFEKELLESYNSLPHDEVFEEQFKDAIFTGLSYQFILGMNRLIETNDDLSINRYFQKIIHEKMNFKNISIIVKCEKISSLTMELESLTSKKIDFSQMERKKQEEQRKKHQNQSLDSDNKILQGMDVRLLLLASVVLSPVRGKDISTVQSGDRIRLTLIDNHPKVKSIAGAFNAVSDGKIMPITGRVVHCGRRPEGGYMIYAIIAKGIFVRIDEEEDNIKVAMEQTIEDVSEKVEISNKRIAFLIFCIVIFIGTVVTLAIIFF